MKAKQRKADTDAKRENLLLVYSFFSIAQTWKACVYLPQTAHQWLSTAVGGWSSLLPISTGEQEGPALTSSQGFSSSGGIASSAEDGLDKGDNMLLGDLVRDWNT